jgi:DnaK suppressor protein
MSPTKSSAKPAPKKKAAAPKKAVVNKAEPKKTAAPLAAPPKAAAPKKEAVAPAPKKAAEPKAEIAKAEIKKVSAAEAKARAESLLQGFGNFKPYETKKGEEYMSGSQLNHFRQLLLSWKHALMEEVDRTVHYMQDEAANFPDPNDRASQESDFTMELRTRDRERKLIKKIEESITMLDSGDYGFCESCGVEIGIRRLEARPTAVLCIDCKTLDEIKEKQKGG